MIVSNYVKLFMFVFMMCIAGLLVWYKNRKGRMV